MKRTTRLGQFTFVAALTALLLCGSFAWATPASGQDDDDSSGNTYLTSDDYSNDDIIKNVFLKDPEYAKMTADFKHKGSDELDWGWIAPNFNRKSYQTVHITVKDDYGVLNPDFNKAIEQQFAAVAKRLGWKVTSSKSADLELGLDIVGYDEDSHFAFVTTIQPSVELEIRLRDKSGKDVYLIRNREHSGTPSAAAREMAHDVMKQLR